MGRLLDGFYGACMLGLWGIRGVTELARKNGKICVLFGYIESGQTYPFCWVG